MPPLVPVAIAWVVGLLIADRWLLPAGVAPATIAILLAIPLAAILLWHRERKALLYGLSGLALISGALRLSLSIPNLNDPGLLAYHNDRGWLMLEGVICEYPDIRDTWTNLTIHAESIHVDGQTSIVRGAALVRVPRFPEYRYGDRLRVWGLLKTPPSLEGFAYRAYLERKGIYSVVERPQVEWIASAPASSFRAVMYAVKDRARDSIARLLAEPEASVMQGILLGIRSGIPKELYADYNTTGTSHIIVISGANIALLAAVLSRTTSRLLGKRRGYWFTLVAIVIYVLLVGADAAAARAGVMGGLYVTARYLGRRATAYVSLLASAVLLTAIRPSTLWDVGFQLSFAATLGLVLFVPPVERFLERILSRFIARDRARQAVRYLNDVLIVTLAAQILTVPLVVYYFRRLSLVAPLANLLILPVQPPIMGWGGIVALLGLVPFLTPLAQVVAWLPWLCLAYTNAIARGLARLPFASLEIGRVDLNGLVLFYLMLLGLVFLVRRIRTDPPPLWTRITDWVPSGVALGTLLCASIATWMAFLQLPDGQLHVAFLNVGQGDAMLITSPAGHQVLIDGGPSPSALTAALGREMPFWDRSIDLLVMTHADADHITGLVEVLKRYRVQGWAESGVPDDSALYLQCQTLLSESQIPRHLMRAGSGLELGDGVFLEVLHPGTEPISGTTADGNNNSVVVRLVYDQAAFLLTGDVEAEAEQQLLQSGQPLAADVLKVGHHGSARSTTAEFLAAVSPEFAVISVGADNPFGHPDPALLDRLASRNTLTILRTDKVGTVEFVTDGRKMWIQAERE